MNVCIKNINVMDWKDFKAESIKHGLRVGDFFNKLVREHKERCQENNWEKILYGTKPLKGILSREDAKELREEFRKDFEKRF